MSARKRYLLGHWKHLIVAVLEISHRDFQNISSTLERYLRGVSIDVSLGVYTLPDTVEKINLEIRPRGCAVLRFLLELLSSFAQDY